MRLITNKYRLFTSETIAKWVFALYYLNITNYFKHSNKVISTQSNDFAFVSPALEGLAGVAIGLIIADLVGIASTYLHYMSLD